jgi:hypothetical protein
MAAVSSIGAAATRIVLVAAVPEMSEAARGALLASVEAAFRSVERPTCRIESVVRLVGGAATPAAVADAIRGAVSHLAIPDSRAVIYYNGHGDQIRDAPNGDERGGDGRDEVWRLPRGGILTDDAITAIIDAAPCAPSSFVTLVSDSCSSGTMIDDTAAAGAGAGPRSAGAANWCCIAACSPTQSALGTADGGVFTLFGLIPTLRELSLRDSCATAHEIREGVARRLSIPTQTLTITTAGGRAALLHSPIV